MSRGLKGGSVATQLRSMVHNVEVIEALLQNSRWECPPEWEAKVNSLRQMGVAAQEPESGWRFTTVSRSFFRMITGGGPRLFEMGENHVGFMERCEALFESWDRSLARGAASETEETQIAFIEALDQIADAIADAIARLDNYLTAEYGTKETIALRLEQGQHALAQGERLAGWLEALHGWHLYERSQETQARKELWAAMWSSIYRAGKIDRWRDQVRNALEKIRKLANSQRKIAAQVSALRSVAFALAEDSNLWDTLGAFSDAQAVSLTQPEPIKTQTWVDVSDSNQRLRWADLAEKAAQKATEADAPKEKKASGAPLDGAGVAEKVAATRKVHEVIFAELIRQAKKQAPEPLSVAKWLRARPNGGFDDARKLGAWVAWSLRPQSARAPFKVVGVTERKPGLSDTYRIVDARVIFFAKTSVKNSESAEPFSPKNQARPPTPLAHASEPLALSPHFETLDAGPAMETPALVKNHGEHLNEVAQ